VVAAEAQVDSVAVTIEEVAVAVVSVAEVVIEVVAAAFVVVVVLAADFVVDEDVATDIRNKKLLFFLRVTCHFLYGNDNDHCCFSFSWLYTQNVQHEIKIYRKHKQTREEHGRSSIQRGTGFERTTSVAARILRSVPLMIIK
jgi:hypothetical protein